MACPARLFARPVSIPINPFLPRFADPLALVPRGKIVPVAAAAEELKAPAIAARGVVVKPIEVLKDRIMFYQRFWAFSVEKLETLGLH